MWIYILKSKDDVFQKFLEWKALAENSSGHKLKVLRTDNGGEYTSAEFESYLKREGIRHERTIPKTPEENGVAERKNRTLAESVRSILADAKLPHKFWAEALSTAVYLQNRSPTKALNKMTPYQAWRDERPTVNHLRIFGYTAFAHVSKDQRKKLDSKARKCIFLGYGSETKGYRLYDPERRRVFHSRDVIFHEFSNYSIEEEPTATKRDEKHEHLVEFDYSLEEPGQDDESKLVLRKSTRERKPPDYYGEWVTIANSELGEPESVKEAMSGPDKVKWQEAMGNEMKPLQENHVWDLVELPKDKKAIGSKWVFKLKTNTLGSVERYKARLLAQGFSQKFGSDYDEAFSPVVRFESVRTVISLATQHGLQLHQMET